MLVADLCLCIVELCQCVCVCAYVCEGVCVSVCVSTCEKEREMGEWDREREYVCVREKCLYTMIINSLKYVKRNPSLVFFTHTFKRSIIFCFKLSNYIPCASLH